MILNRQRTVRVARPPLEAFLARVRGELRLDGAEITIALVSDPAIARLNQTYRHKKGPTDVLSFPTDNHDVQSKHEFVGAQHRCALIPQDRSVKISRVRPSLAPSNRSLRRRQGTASAVPTSMNRKGASAPEANRERTTSAVPIRRARQGTASAVPNTATTKGASAPEGNAPDAHSLGDIAISPPTAR